MISYDAELRLFENILRQFNLSVKILPLDDEGLFRRAISFNAVQNNSEYIRKLEDRLRKSVRDKVIYHLTDEFSCHYSFLLLPEHREKTLMVVGPYVNSEKDQAWINRFVEERGIHSQWVSIIENFYRSVPCLNNEKVLSAALNSQWVES